MKHVNVKFNDEQYQMLKELQEILQGMNVAGKITQSDVLKYAVEQAYRDIKEK
ncbi:hypothetical protein AB1I92_29625 [Bacillus mobilis]|uniref:Uncharacterized protein n=1 Tax=Bacillus mobilis TaxID=2026190 RepID=A0ABV4S6C8_9BACI